MNTARVSQLARLPLSERIFAVCALSYASTAFIRLLMSEEQYSAAGEEILGSPVKRVAWPLIYILAAYFLARFGKLNLKTVLSVPLLAVLLCYIALSIFWSGSIFVSIISVVALVGNTLVGLYFGVRYRGAEFLRLLGWVYAIIIFGTLFARIAIGNAALVDGFWAGFFTQRNALGMNAAIGLLVFAMLARNREKGWWSWLALASLSATLVLLSGSGTSILALFLVGCGYIWYALLKKHTRSTTSRSVLSIAVMLCFLFALVSGWDTVLSAFGKRPDLTGRTEIWGASLLMAQDKPLFGYGYGGFWVYGGPAQVIWDGLGGGDPSNLSYAHNGYLQILLDTGIIGLALLLALVAFAFRKAWAYAEATKDVWPLCFFAFMALDNLGEGTYAERNSLCWLLFVAMLVQMVRALQVDGVGAVNVSLRGARVLSASAES